MNVDLAKRAGIENADGVAYSQTFAVHGVMHGFPIARVIPRSFPLSDVFEAGTVDLVPVMHGCHAYRIGKVADVSPSQHPECDGRERRPERRGPQRRDIRIQRPRQDRQCIDIAGLALVGAHPEGCVAFQVLHRAIAFSRRHGNVGGRHIILKIDELFAWDQTFLKADPQRAWCCFHLRRSFRRPWRLFLELEAGLGSGLEARRMAFRQTALERKASVSATYGALRLH